MEATSYRSLPAGQGSALIDDGYPSASDVVDELVEDAETAFDRLDEIRD